MADLLNVIIDVSETGIGSIPADLEDQSLILADEMRAGGLVDSVRLAREQELPEGAKAGLLSFLGGVLTAEISRESLKKVIDFLGNRFYGKELTVSYKKEKKESGETTQEFSFTGNPKELDKFLAAIEQFEDIQIRVAEQSSPPN